MKRLLPLLCGVTLVAACQTPSVPTLPTPAEPKKSISFLAGAYTAIVDFSPSCAAIPDLSQPRTYPVTLKAYPQDTYIGLYAGVGGFGDMWPNLTGVSFRWSSGDHEDCGGSLEPLPGGRMLAFCSLGWGSGDVTPTTIIGPMPADVFIVEADGQRRQVCSGMHQFTFTRVPQ